MVGEGLICPGAAVSEYLLSRSEGQVHMDGSPLTRFKFSAVFKRCLSQAGERPGDFGTHLGPRRRHILLIIFIIQYGFQFVL